MTLPYLLGGKTVPATIDTTLPAAVRGLPFYTLSESQEQFAGQGGEKAPVI